MIGKFSSAAFAMTEPVVRPSSSAIAFIGLVPASMRKRTMSPSVQICLNRAIDTQPLKLPNLALPILGDMLRDCTTSSVPLAARGVALGDTPCASLSPTTLFQRRLGGAHPTGTGLPERVASPDAVNFMMTVRLSIFKTALDQSSSPEGEYMRIMPNLAPRRCLQRAPQVSTPAGSQGRRDFC